MKVYLNIGKKVNFVDENNRFVGYNLEQDCCENANWFIADTPQCAVQSRSTDNPDLDGFVFDPIFFIAHPPNPVDSDTELSMVIFRIVKGDHEKFIHLFNIHNGYYKHGFEFGEDCIPHRTGKI